MLHQTLKSYGVRYIESSIRLFVTGESVSASGIGFLINKHSQLNLEKTGDLPEIGRADREKEAVGVQDGSTTGQRHISQLFPAHK
jgi:hypothetical protein